MHIAEVVHNEIAGIVAGILRSNRICSLSEGRHTIVAFEQVIDSSNAILCLGIDLLTMQTGRDELIRFTLLDDALHTFAHALASSFSNLLEEFHPLVACKSCKADFVLKGCHV